MFYKQLPDQTRNEKVDFFAHEKHAHCYTKSYFVGKKAMLILKAISVALSL
jgi:hypothetical protein